MASRACLVAVALQVGLWHSALADPTISFDEACIQDQMQAFVQSPEQEAINCEVTGQDPALGKALTQTLAGRQIVSEAMQVLSEPEGMAYLKTIMADGDYQEQAKQISIAIMEAAKREPTMVSQMVLELGSPENQAKLQEIMADPNFRQYVKSLVDPMGTSPDSIVDKVFSKSFVAPIALKVPLKSVVSASPSAVRPLSAEVQRGSDIMMNEAEPRRYDENGEGIVEPLKVDPILIAVQCLPFLALLVFNPF